MCSYKAVDTFTQPMAVTEQAATTFHWSVTPCLPAIRAQLGSEPPKMHIGICLDWDIGEAICKADVQQSYTISLWKAELFTAVISYLKLICGRLKG